MTVPASFRTTIGLSPSTVSVNSKKTALLIIDSQGTYNIGSPLEISGFTESQKAINKAADLYRSASAPVIWIQHTAGAGAPIFDEAREESFGFVGENKPTKGESVIIKKAPSSFTGTELDSLLKKEGIEQVVLTGYMAHVCVTGTARSAMEHGYDVVILKDAIGDRDIPSVDSKSTVTGTFLVDAVCTELADAIGTVLNVADIKA